jgi:hypothetical protein
MGWGLKKLNYRLIRQEKQNVTFLTPLLGRQHVKEFDY